MRFYLGTHQPAWLSRDLGVPLLVSHRRLAGRRSLPRATGPWALDSGGFTELSMYGRWRTTEHAYITAVRRYANEIGQLAWAAPMDHMTEAQVLSRTGGTVRSHQQRTVANYLCLREMAPELPIIPVLQGQSLSDYHRCAGWYERHGVDLAALPLVGVGSVCRRQHTAEVEQILQALAARGYRLHAFGAKVLGLGRFADAIASSDSAAWSFRGRYVPGCTPSHRSESNCQRFALAWHARLQASLSAEKPGSRDSRCAAGQRPLPAADGSPAHRQKSRPTSPRTTSAPRLRRPGAAAHIALAAARRPARTGVHHAHH
jgi:hypothetical protein